MSVELAHTRISIATAGDVGEARRMAALLCHPLGLDDTDAGRVALVVTEAASNIQKHAGRGELLLRPLSTPDSGGMEILALDKGPGMDVERCMRDGYSTAGSPGSGLGAISRLASQWDVYSIAGGTVLLARILAAGAKAPPPPELEVGGVCVALAGESACGDAWTQLSGPDGTRILVADGLGHGPLAAEASSAAVRVLHERPQDDIAGLLQSMHPALMPTRGAAVAVADVEHASDRVRYAGAGNIAGALLDGPKSRGLLTQNGTVGVEMRRVQPFDYAWPGPRGLLVMHSDGLNTRWDLRGYPGLLSHRPTTIAAVLYRDYSRGRDDTTVVVARKPEPAP